MLCILEVIYIMSCTITDTRESRKLFLAWLKEGIELFKEDNPEKKQCLQKKYGISHQKKIWESIMDTIHTGMSTDEEATINFVDEIVTSICGISFCSKENSIVSPMFIPVSFLKLEVPCLVLDMMTMHRAYFPTSGVTLLQQWDETKTVYEKFLESKSHFLPIPISYVDLMTTPEVQKLSSQKEKYIYLENIAPAINSSKFYRMYYFDDPSTSTFTAEWGKIGYFPQSKTYPLSKWHSLLQSKKNKGYEEENDGKTIVLNFFSKNQDTIWNIAMGTWRVLSDSAYWTRKSPIREIEQRGRRCLNFFINMANDAFSKHLPSLFITTIMTSYGEMLESASSFPASATHLDALGRILSLSKDMDTFLNIKRPLWLDESLYSWVSPLRLRCMNHFVDMNDKIRKTHSKGNEKENNVDWGIFR